MPFTRTTVPPTTPLPHKAGIMGTQVEAVNPPIERCSVVSLDTIEKPHGHDGAGSLEVLDAQSAIGGCLALGQQARLGITPCHRPTSLARRLLCARQIPRSPPHMQLPSASAGRAANRI